MFCFAWKFLFSPSRLGTAHPPLFSTRLDHGKASSRVRDDMRHPYDGSFISTCTPRSSVSLVSPFRWYRSERYALVLTAHPAEAVGSPGLVRVMIASASGPMQQVVGIVGEMYGSGRMKVHAVGEMEVGTLSIQAGCAVSFTLYRP